MAHELFTVQFYDGARMYGVWEGVTGTPYKLLFLSVDEATAWLESGLAGIDEPMNAVSSEEAVIFDPDEPWAFESRASRTAHWLTGPGNSDQLLSEISWTE